VKLAFLKEFTRFENFYDDYKSVDSYQPAKNYYEPEKDFSLEEDPLFKI
jgi:hypothetical protein